MASVRSGILGRVGGAAGGRRSFRNLGHTGAVMRRWRVDAFVVDCRVGRRATFRRKPLFDSVGTVCDTT